MHWSDCESSVMRSSLLLAGGEHIQMTTESSPLAGRIGKANGPAMNSTLTIADRETWMAR